MIDDPFVITSAQNPKVKEIIRPRERRDRDQTRTFLIEGYRELYRAVHGSVKVDRLFVCPELFLGENEGALIEKIRKSGATVYTCAKNVFEKISYRDRPDGLLAIAPQLNYTLDTLQKKIDKSNKAPFFIVAEAIEKPGNLGTILRSADASGVDGVIVCDRCTDIHNPNVVRASVGTLFTVPVVEASGEETLAWLRKNNILIMAATPSAEKEYTQVDMTKGVAVAVGTEQYGLSARWMDNADYRVKIPMLGIADSLNVATATTLMLYEVVRQRRTP